MIARFLTESVIVHETEKGMASAVKENGFGFRVFQKGDQNSFTLPDGKPGNWFMKRLEHDILIFCCSYASDMGNRMVTVRVEIIAKAADLDGISSYDSKFGGMFDPKMEPDKARDIARKAREAVRKISRASTIQSAVKLMDGLAKEAGKAK